MATSTVQQPGGPAALDRALEGLAVGRILLGAASLAAPGAISRALGVRHSPEIAYLTRIYGGRAIALGTAYLLGGPEERARLRALSFGVDASDTLTGMAHLVRRDTSPRAATLLTALTGGYAAVGATRLRRR